MYLKSFIKTLLLATAFFAPLFAIQTGERRGVIALEYLEEIMVHEKRESAGQFKDINMTLKL